MSKDANTVLARGNEKQTIRHGYYRRVRYFRAQKDRFNKDFRKTEPTCCLRCGYSTCRCFEGVTV